MNFTRHFALVLITGLRLAAQAAPQLQGVGAAMHAIIDAQEVAGAVTLVTNKDKIMHLEATGFADLAGKKPMAPDTMFWLASTTKPFTGVAILMLQDAGRLNIGDPVAKYIPAFADLKTPSGTSANLTIAQLLTHTSGLADTPPKEYIVATALADFIPRRLAEPMRFEPGERWKYASSEIDVAGHIVEIVSGKSFDAFLRERLFDPLAMKDTTFHPTKAQLMRMATCYVKDDDTGELRPQPPIWPTILRETSPPLPAGGLFSTASDLGQFCRMLLNHAVLDGKRYLSEASYRNLTMVQTGDLPTNFSAAQYSQAFGWGLGVYVLRVPHAGVSAMLSPGSFGHPGAAGTDFIVDPVKGVAYVLMIQRLNLPDNFDNKPGRAFLQAAVTALAKAE